MRTRFNVALVLALLLIVAPITAAADRVITLYPIALLNGTIAGEYEWETGTDFARVVHFSAAGVASSDEKAFAIAGGYGIHKYLDGQALNGSTWVARFQRSQRAPLTPGPRTALIRSSSVSTVASDTSTSSLTLS